MRLCAAAQQRDVTNNNHANLVKQITSAVKIWLTFSRAMRLNGYILRYMFWFRNQSISVNTYRYMCRIWNFDVDEFKFETDQFVR